ncbi:MAG: hypothetical protein V1676_01380 [Candidatus Diapherotrites archaeon]
MAVMQKNKKPVRMVHGGGVHPREIHSRGQGMFCPNCGSADLKMVQTPVFVQSGTFRMYKCGNCGYEGPIVIGGLGMQKGLMKNYSERKGRGLDG